MILLIAVFSQTGNSQVQSPYMEGLGLVPGLSVLRQLTLVILC